MGKVDQFGGVPTLFIDAEPEGPMCYTPGGRDAWERREMAKRGFRLFFEMVHNVGWPGEQDAVFKHVDDTMRRVLRDAPDCRVILRLYVCHPPHFATRYPEETMAFNDGTTQHFTQWYGQDDTPPSERGYPSFASRVWRDKTSEALQSYVRYICAAPYAKHIVGYFLCGGGTEEWYYYENFDESKFCVDFSPAMEAAFRAYLREKYAEPGRLQSAWNDSDVAFESAELPDLASRWATDDGVFWDPQKSQRVIDYFYVHNKVMEDAILQFARSIKIACRGEQLVGAFYGYLQNMWLVKGGQATFKDFLRCPDIDFCAAPPQYDRRGVGEHGCIRFLNGSVKEHGKIWINESDIRTVFSRANPQNPLRDGRSLDVDGSLSCLKREFAHLLCEGATGWWLQPGSNDYHDESILSLFSQMQRIGKAALRFDRASDTDIAAVVDQESILTGPAFSRNTAIHLVTPSLLDAFRVQETCRIGSPVDYYELEDILPEDARRYRLYLM